MKTSSPSYALTKIATIRLSNEKPIGYDTRTSVIDKMNGGDVERKIANSFAIGETISLNISSVSTTILNPGNLQILVNDDLCAILPTNK